jgi:hypothetical protein
MEKSNQILQKLSASQKDGFREIWKNEKYKNVLESFFSRAMYVNGGYKMFQEFLNLVLETKNNVTTINYPLLDYYDKILSEIDQEENAAQTPGAVDANLFSTLYCKELTVYGPQTYMYFDSYTFRFYTDQHTPEGEYCEEIGISWLDMKPYRAKDYPVTKHVAYFQGTHDGATPAKGAADHWLNVPQSTSQFLTSTRGGHTPMAQRLRIYEDEDSTAEEKQKRLTLTILSQNAFTTAMSGQMVPNSTIDAINLFLDPDQQWFVPQKTVEGLNQINEAARNVRSIQ